MNQVVTAVQHVEHGIVAFVYGDGSIHIHDVVSMNNLHNQQELGKATTLAQAGFSFQGLQPENGGLHVALSPNACLAAFLDDTGKVQCQEMRLWQTSQSEEDHNR